MAAVAQRALYGRREPRVVSLASMGTTLVPSESCEHQFASSREHQFASSRDRFISDASLTSTGSFFDPNTLLERPASPDEPPLPPPPAYQASVDGEEAATPPPAQPVEPFSNTVADGRQWCYCTHFTVLLTSGGLPIVQGDGIGMAVAACDDSFIVTAVSHGGMAAAAKLLPGDVIFEIDEQAIVTSSYRAIERARSALLLASSRPVQLSVRRVKQPFEGPNSEPATPRTWSRSSSGSALRRLSSTPAFLRRSRSSRLQDSSQRDSAREDLAIRAEAQRRAFAARTFLERQELEVALASSCYDEGAEREELETAMEMSEQETAINDAIDRSLSSAQEQVEQATEEKAAMDEAIARSISFARRASIKQSESEWEEAATMRIALSRSRCALVEEEEDGEEDAASTSGGRFAALCRQREKSNLPNARSRLEGAMRNEDDAAAAVRPRSGSVYRSQTEWCMDQLSRPSLVESARDSESEE